MGKTKIVQLTDEQHIALEKGYRKGTSHTFRMRCQMILLKSEKRTSLEVAEVLGCCEMAINNWRETLFGGRHHRFGNACRTWATADFKPPESGSSAQGENGNQKASELGENGGCQIGRRFGFSDAPGNLAPLLKKNECRFCRARTSLKSRQVAVEREEKQKQLSVLWWLYMGGRIDLCFGDESAFSMNPKLPYGWSPKGARVEIFLRRDKKVNLFGIFRPDNFCVTYERTGNINSEFVIKAIDDFCRHVEKPSVLVLDNAPTHRSAKFLQQIERWMEKDLYIFFLPKYLAEQGWKTFSTKSASHVSSSQVGHSQVLRKMFSAKVRKFRKPPRKVLFLSHQ